MRTREEIMAIAESVLDGKPRSYVEAARVLAAFVLTDDRTSGPPDEPIGGSADGRIDG